MRLGVIDYGASNIHSVARALEFLGSKVSIVDTPDKFNNIDKLVFPGQGSMGSCVKKLKETEMFNPLLEAIKSKPFLGICLGLQMLFEISDEGNQKGFGLLPGKVIKFKSDYKERIKIPHMGWNSVMQSNAHPMWRNIRSGSKFYFVHSYFVRTPQRELVAGTCNYGVEFDVALTQENLFAVQFHPEKSHTAGLQLLKNFVEWDGKL